MTTHISSYPSVFALGHKAIEGIFEGEVIVEEKVDGSQFSMAILDGELCCRSKGKDLVLDEPEAMFVKAVETAQSLPLTPGWIYRGEFLAKPKHNTLRYSRVPEKNLILYDIQTGLEEYMTPGEKQAEAERLGLEVVPLLHRGKVNGMADLDNFLDRDSILGGTKVEGVVVKNYALMTSEKKAAMGKYVSERFKEIHGKAWKAANPNTKDVIANLIEMYSTEARWEKAVQHLRDTGTLEGSPRDIGALIREVPDDVLKECVDEIRDKLFAYAWPHIKRDCQNGTSASWQKSRSVRRN